MKLKIKKLVVIMLGLPIIVVPEYGAIHYCWSHNEAADWIDCYPLDVEIVTL